MTPEDRRAWIGALPTAFVALLVGLVTILPSCEANRQRDEEIYRSLIASLDSHGASSRLSAVIGLKDFLHGKHAEQTFSVLVERIETENDFGVLRSIFEDLSGLKDPSEAALNQMGWVERYATDRLTFALIDSGYLHYLQVKSEYPLRERVRLALNALDSYAPATRVASYAAFSPDQNGFHRDESSRMIAFIRDTCVRDAVRDAIRGSLDYGRLPASLQQADQIDVISETRVVVAHALRAMRGGGERRECHGIHSAASSTMLPTHGSARLVSPNHSGSIVQIISPYTMASLGQEATLGIQKEAPRGIPTTGPKGADDLYFYLEFSEDTTFDKPLAFTVYGLNGDLYTVAYYDPMARRRVPCLLTRAKVKAGKASTASTLEFFGVPHKLILHGGSRDSRPIYWFAITPQDGRHTNYSKCL